jgi:hypothetical protein
MGRARSRRQLFTRWQVASPTFPIKADAKSSTCTGRWLAPRNRLTDIDALKSGYNWSPDSKEIAFAASDNNLRKLTVATKQVTVLDTSHYGGFSDAGLVA